MARSIWPTLSTVRDDQGRTTVTLDDPDARAASDHAHVEAGFEAIAEERCLALLREGAVGLLALPGEGAPDVRPVNFALHRHRIVMRTGRHRIFESARRGEPASFVLCEFDRFEHSGWSVVVTGRLAIGDPTDSAIRTRVRPWASAEKSVWVLLSIDEITGREIARGSHA